MWVTPVCSAFFPHLWSGMCHFTELLQEISLAMETCGDSPGGHTSSWSVEVGWILQGKDSRLWFPKKWLLNNWENSPSFSVSNLLPKVLSSFYFPLWLLLQSSSCWLSSLHSHGHVPHSISSCFQEISWISHRLKISWYKRQLIFLPVATPHLLTLS